MQSASGLDLRIVQCGEAARQFDSWDVVLSAKPSEQSQELRPASNPDVQPCPASKFFCLAQR
jgi:hypothetical protein